MPSETNAEGLVIRPRQPADLDSCAQALVDVHRTDGYPVEGVDDPVGWLTPPGLINAWVAEVSGNIVGHVAISEPQETDDAVRRWLSDSRNFADAVAVLGRLFVVFEARGSALGKRLVVAATHAAEAIGRRLVLDVMEKDRAAITIYEQLGWSYIGSAEHTFGQGMLTPALCYVSPRFNAT